MSAETNSGEGIEEERTRVPGESSMIPTQEAPAAQAPETTIAEPAKPQAEGRRTQLKIVRENLQSLSRDMGSFRKNTLANTKKLEAHLVSLRKDLAMHVRSKELGEHAKSHALDTKRLEKQIAMLRGEVDSLRSQVAKEAAKSRTSQEAAFSKLIAKVKEVKPPKPPKPPKKSKARTSKSKQ